MKQFQINGSVNLLKAVLEDLREIGFPIDDEWNTRNNPERYKEDSITGEIKLICEHKDGIGWYTINCLYESYTLPADYEKVLQVAKESLEPTYEIGDWVVAEITNSNYIGIYGGKNEDGKVLLTEWWAFKPHTDNEFINKNPMTGGSFTKVVRKATEEQVALVKKLKNKYQVGDYIFYNYYGADNKTLHSDASSGVNKILGISEDGKIRTDKSTYLVNIKDLEPGSRYDNMIRLATEKEIEEYNFPYKVGDWVYVIANGGNNVNHRKYRTAAKEGDVVQITGFDKDSYGEYKVALTNVGAVIYIEEHPSLFRKATLEEIDELRIPTISGYKADFSSKGIVAFGCQKWTKDDIWGIIRLVKNGASIKFGDIDVTEKILKTIVSKIG